MIINVNLSVTRYHNRDTDADKKIQNARNGKRKSNKEDDKEDMGNK